MVNPIADYTIRARSLVFHFSLFAIRFLSPYPSRSSFKNSRGLSAQNSS